MNELKEKYEINLKALDEISSLLDDYAKQITKLSGHLKTIKKNIEIIKISL